MTEEVLDKTLVYINSSNAAFTNNPSEYKFSYNLAEPIKDAMYLMNVRTELLVDVSALHTLNGAVIEDGDPIFIRFNDYYKLVANVNNGTMVKCFDTISLNITDKIGMVAPTATPILFKNEITSTVCSFKDINTYVINPVDPNFKRIEISLHDKNFDPIPKDFIKKFTMLVCVYHNRKKLSMA